MPVTPPASGASSLTVAEVDGTPSLTATTLVVSNGSLTNSGGGTATVVTSGGGGSVAFMEEGAAVGTGTILNFVGAGVTTTFSGGTAIATIPGGSNQLGSITAASAAIANTETVVASASLAAGYLAAGMSFRIRAAGVGTTLLTPGVDTFRIRIGPTTLTGVIPTSVAPPANASVTNQSFNFEALLTVRTIGATGSIIGGCEVQGDNVATGLFTMLQDLSATVATVAVDTTVANLLELTFQSGAADSTCTFHVAPIEVLSSGAAGGGGGAPTTVPYVTTAVDGTLSAEIVIPGLAGSADIRVAGTNDDEFDTTDTTDPMTGWTTLGTPTSHDINSTVPSHYRVRQAAQAAAAMVGIYKASPAVPFTVTCKLSDVLLRGDYNRAGLFVGEATPGKMAVLQTLFTTTTDQMAVYLYSNPTTYLSTTVGLFLTGGTPLYLRCTVTTTTNVAWYYSYSGKVWRPLITAHDPAMTIGSVGLFCASQNATYDGEAIFDWIRFT